MATDSYVIKRNDEKQHIDLQKIITRLRGLAFDIQPALDLPDQALVNLATQGILKNFFVGIRTDELDRIAWEICARKSAFHTDYHALAARLFASNLQKNVKVLHRQHGDSLMRVYGLLPCPLSARFLERLESPEWTPSLECLDPSRDFCFNFMSINMMFQKYLWRKPNGGEAIETPQHLYYRVALNLAETPGEVTELYDALSLGYYSHATPTFFNVGLKKGNINPCFLATMEDSIEDIADTVKEAMFISKHCGGYGVCAYQLRSDGSIIHSAPNAHSSGVIPFAGVFNNVARAVNQGSKRKGSIALYLCLWHADIEAFLDLRKAIGKEERRARDLFYGLMINDEFMRRVEGDESWTLFDPSEVVDLLELYGEQFSERYGWYEQNTGLGKKTMRARDLMRAIHAAAVETGMPYLIFLAATNEKSNQKNLGLIKCSNLCTEVMEVSNAEETAVCTLATLCLPKFVNALPLDLQGTFGVSNDPFHYWKVRDPLDAFDWERFLDTTALVVRVLNSVIDVSYYPTERARLSNQRHRPLGIGIQGLADAIAMLPGNLSWEDPEIAKFNEQVAAFLYYGALKESCAQARLRGRYESFAGSPTASGILQYDLWNEEPFVHPLLDWEGLKEDIAQWGLRNSLLISYPPTASTARLQGNTEGFEAFYNNVYVANLLSGNFVLINKHLVRDLKKLGLWTQELVGQIIADKGSVQGLDIDGRLKKKYRTVWEIGQRVLFDMTALRAPYVCHSQSLNWYIADPTFDKFCTAAFYTWRKGLKTGMYYLRQPLPVDPLPYTAGKGTFKTAVVERRDRQRGAPAAGCLDNECCSG